MLVITVFVTIAWLALTKHPLALKPGRRFLLTVFYDPPADLGVFDEWMQRLLGDQEKVRWVYVYQREAASDTGREHLQVYVYTGRRTHRPSRFGKPPLPFKPPHVEYVKSAPDSYDYCTKDDTRLSGPYYFPTDSVAQAHRDRIGKKGGGAGHRADLSDAKAAIDESGGRALLDLVHVGDVSFGVYCGAHRALEKYHSYVQRRHFASAARS